MSKPATHKPYIHGPKSGRTEYHTGLTFTTEQVANIRHLLEVEGLSIHQAATRYNLTDHTFNKALKRAGVTLTSKLVTTLHGSSLPEAKEATK